MATNRQIFGARAPRSIPSIAKSATEFVYDAAIPFKNWLRAARLLRQQAEVYEAEGDLESAYELYFRQVVLVLEKLPAHPEVRSGSNKALLRAATKDANISLDRAEALKPWLKKAWEEWESRRVQREAAGSQKRASRQPGQPGSRPGSSHSGYDRLSGDFGVYRREEYDGRHHPELALEVARRDQRSNGYSRNEPVRPVENEEMDLSEQMRGVRLRMDGKAPTQQVPTKLTNKPSQSNSWAYPSVPESRPNLSGAQQELWFSGAGDSARSQSLQHPESLSIRPPPVVPALPGKEPLNGSSAPARPPKESSTPTPDTYSYSAAPPQLPPKSLPPTTTRADTFVFKPAAFLENGASLRTIFFPPSMRLDFLRIAQQNTAANLETCGVLLGRLKSNALFIESLFIPDQKATANSCEMTEDGETGLWEYTDRDDLMQLGWIHTHPTQTCFMSSADLHTHCGYQTMLPESIAIVCAPSQNDWAAFRLTHPPGLGVIQNCTDPRMFHPHDVQDNVLYKDARRPGHVVELAELPYTVYDMRTAK